MTNLGLCTIMGNIVITTHIVTTFKLTCLLFLIIMTSLFTWAEKLPALRTIVYVVSNIQIWTPIQDFQSFHNGYRNNLNKTWVPLMHMVADSCNFVILWRRLFRPFTFATKGQTGKDYCYFVAKAREQNHNNLPLFVPWRKSQKAKIRIIFVFSLCSKVTKKMKRL